MYRNKNELRKFGSDLNKYLYEECEHNHSACNIDLVQVKDRTVRFIESKHWGENSSDSQQRLLRTILFSAFNILNSVQHAYEFQLYIVKGEFPWSGMVSVENLLSGNKKILTEEQDLKDFLEFKNEI